MFRKVHEGIHQFLSDPLSSVLLRHHKGNDACHLVFQNGRKGACSLIILDDPQHQHIVSRGHLRHKRCKIGIIIRSDLCNGPHVILFSLSVTQEPFRNHSALFAAELSYMIPAAKETVKLFRFSSLQCRGRITASRPEGRTPYLQTG